MDKWRGPWKCEKCGNHWEQRPGQLSELGHMGLGDSLYCDGKVVPYERRRNAVDFAEVERLRQRVNDLEGYHGTEYDRMKAQRVVIEEGGSRIDLDRDGKLFAFAVDMVLKLDRQNYAYGECLKRIQTDRRRAAPGVVEVLEKLADDWYRQGTQKNMVMSGIAASMELSAALAALRPTCAEGGRKLSGPSFLRELDGELTCIQRAMESGYIPAAQARLAKLIHRVRKLRGLLPGEEADRDLPQEE